MSELEKLRKRVELLETAESIHEDFPEIKARGWWITTGYGPEGPRLTLHLCEELQKQVEALLESWADDPH